MHQNFEGLVTISQNTHSFGLMNRRPAASQGFTPQKAHNVTTVIVICNLYCRCRCNHKTHFIYFLLALGYRGLGKKENVTEKVAYKFR